MSEDNYRLFGAILSCVTVLVGIVMFVLVIKRDERKLKLHRPELDLEPCDFPLGELTFLNSDSSPVAARYWHVQVFNRKAWFLAKQVELSLLHLSIRHKATPKEERCDLNGAIAIKEKRNSIRNDVGEKEVTFDLFRVVKDRGINLMFADKIPNSLNPFLSEAGIISMTIQARGDNGVSNKLFIEVEWDGDGMACEEPAEHLRITCKTD